MRDIVWPFRLYKRVKQGATQKVGPYKDRCMPYSQILDREKGCGFYREEKFYITDTW